MKQKITALLLTFTVLLPSVTPYNNLWANNNGPNAPEAAGFEPVDATDMVNLATGDVSYVMPLLDMDGFPVSLSYHAGIPMDLESTWVGLGWNINTGAINRSQTGVPDDWNNGKSLDFISFTKTEKLYTINVGVGISNVADVGIGMTWGSNKAITGSVYASAGIKVSPNNTLGASVSISADGNYSAGIGINFGGQEGGAAFGFGASVSGNLYEGDVTYGIGINAGTQNAQANLGFSFSGSGTSKSVGISGGNLAGSGSEKNNVGGGASISSGSFVEGDFEISTSGFYVPIQIYIFTLGFGHQKVTFSLQKGFEKSGYGILYSSYGNDTDTSINSSGFNDHQNRYVYGDMFEQSLPVPEKDFVGDYRQNIEKINFVHSSYDNYSLNASGIAGTIRPYAFQNMALKGVGYSGSDSNSSEGKLRMYYHNSSVIPNNEKRLFGNDPSQIISRDFRFYFNGQFTENTITPNYNLITSLNRTKNNLGSILYKSGGGREINSRRKAPNFIEVYTNRQIKDGLLNGLLLPESLLNRNTDEFEDEGIGAYKVTAPDGKTYHFSLPVYHFEMVKRTLIKDNSENHVNEQRQYSPYATHWFLTAITGPDFIDKNGNNIPDNEDYGSWVRLDHGKWSDAYVWRNPATPGAKNYTTNIKGEIENQDFGYYQFGRKQLYYLDKIVTRNNTAYFVKDLRYDAAGRGFKYNYNKSYVNSGRGGIVSEGSKIYVGENGINYKTEYELLLDKIIVVNNNNANIQKNTIGSRTLDVNGLPNYIKNQQYKPSYNEGGGFKEEYGSYSNYKIHNEAGVYDLTDFSGFDYDKALKVIQFKYDYGLAKGTPSSIAISGAKGNPDKGKLCLRSIQNLGRSKVEYMPPFKFDYIGHNRIIYPANAHRQKENVNNVILDTYKDNWGFLKSKPEAWSMNRITTPNGGKIEIEYEEDEYYTEAFSRRYWNEDLNFYNTLDGNDINKSDINISVRKERGLAYDIKFNDYFDVGDRVYLDLWLIRNYRFGNLIGGRTDDLGYLDVKPENEVIVKEVYSDKVVLQVKNSKEVLNGIAREQALDRNFSLKTGGNKFHDVPRGKLITAATPGIQNSTSAWNIQYRLLATKVPIDQSGGGLRAKQIATLGNDGEKYITSYSYSNDDGKSSGITSYSPVNGLKFVPYQSELPSPGVMYGQVEVTNTGISKDGNDRLKTLGSAKYYFHTLKPVWNVFDEELQMNLDESTPIFWANVEDYANDSDGFVTNEPTHKLKAKKIDLHVNTSMIGLLSKVEEYDSNKNLLSRTEHTYKNGQSLELHYNSLRKGTIKESFNSLKSIFRTNADDNSPNLRERLLSISSKNEYNNALIQTRTVTQYRNNIQKYTAADIETGIVTTTESVFPNGKLIIEEKIPAYLKYPEMGAKSTNVANKHMLTQEAMGIVSRKDGYRSPKEVISANITTWNKNWKYRDDFGNELDESDVWRKHKSYVWKEDVNSRGAFVTNNLDDSNFDWDINAIQDTRWQKISEITRYTHNSVAIETKDINGNYTSNKMAKDNNRILATCNSGYSEFYATGAEDIISGNLFEGEVLGANFRTSEDAHTGLWSVKNRKVNEKVFELDKGLQGRFKVSFWSKTHTGETIQEINEDDGIRLVIDGKPIQPTERVISSCWVLNNFIVNITDPDKSIYVTNSKNTGFYFDDFRVHRLQSSMSTYVYDKETNQLTDILGVNNMAIKYCYDLAGKLCTTYVETPSQGEDVGGFKVLSRNRFKYAGVDASVNTCDCLVSTNSCVNPDQDGDGILNTLDNCPGLFNPDQEDQDNDGVGDVCDNDLDNDGFTDDIDFCPSIATVENLDTDNDLIGDACDDDDDGDGILDVDDLCPLVHSDKLWVSNGKPNAFVSFDQNSPQGYRKYTKKPLDNSEDINYLSFSPKINLDDFFCRFNDPNELINGEHPYTLRLYEKATDDLVSILEPKYVTAKTVSKYTDELSCGYEYEAIDLKKNTEYYILRSGDEVQNTTEWSFTTGSSIEMTLITDYGTIQSRGDNNEVYFHQEVDLYYTNNSYPPDFHRSYLNFDTSFIPSDAILESVKLTMYSKEGSFSNKLKVYKGNAPCLYDENRQGIDRVILNDNDIQAIDFTKEIGQFDQGIAFTPTANMPTGRYIEVNLDKINFEYFINLNGTSRLVIVNSDELEFINNPRYNVNYELEVDNFETQFWIHEDPPLLNRGPGNPVINDITLYGELAPKLIVKYRLP